MGSGRMAVVVTVGALACGAAFAQWDPGASQQLGMGHGFTALSQSTMRNAMQLEDDEDGTGDGEVARPGPVPDAARTRALAREYVRRVERDGRAQADAWAFEQGRRDALAARD